MFSDSLGDIWAKKEDLDDFREGLEGLFDDLSSGHKAVLSIITGCVAMMEERSCYCSTSPRITSTRPCLPRSYGLYPSYLSTVIALP